MGARTTWISEAVNIVWPDWFVEKHTNVAVFNGLLASKDEKKLDFWMDVFQDIQVVLAKLPRFLQPFSIVMLHEFGGIEKVSIRTDSILIGTPETFRVSDHSTAEVNETHDMMQYVDDPRGPFTEELVPNPDFDPSQK